MSLPLETDIIRNVAYSQTAKRWYWTAGSGQTGFVSERAIAAELAQMQTAMKATLQELTRQAINGEISIAEFQIAFASEIKSATLAQAIFGAGGVRNMNAISYGRVGGTLRDQYRRLAEFAQGIADGTISEGKALVRAGMYADTTEAAFWNQWVADRPGGADISHLPKLPTRPRQWDTPCGSNCRCFLTENEDGSINWNDTGDERECDVCPGLARGGPYRP